VSSALASRRQKRGRTRPTGEKIWVKNVLGKSLRKFSFCAEAPAPWWGGGLLYDCITIRIRRGRGGRGGFFKKIRKKGRRKE